MSFIIGFVGGELVPHLIAHLLVDTMQTKVRNRTRDAHPSAAPQPRAPQRERVRRTVSRTDRLPVGIPPTGMTVRSSVPGRVRFAAIALRNQPLRARTAEAILRHLPGVRSIAIDPATGSVLVHYDPDILTLARLVAAVTVAVGDQPPHSDRAAIGVAA